MTLCMRILRTIIDEEQPISTYRISKLLNESFNAVKYNIKKLEENKTIIAFKKDSSNNAIYYVPNTLFTEMDAVVDFIEPVICEALETVDMDEDKAKFNFRMLLSLIIDDVIINGKSITKG